MEPTKRPHIVLVLDASGSWDGLYFGGELIAEQPTLYAADVLHALKERLGLDFSVVTVAIDEASHFPRHLNDIAPDGMVNEQP